MIKHIENHIEKMREKPEHIRKRYAFFASLGVTSIIFVFWLASFTINTTVVAKEVKSPLKALTASASDAFSYIKEMIFGANKSQYSSDDSANVEVLPGKI